MITQEAFKELYHYDPSSGIFTSKVTCGIRQTIKGKQASAKNYSRREHYLVIHIYGRMYRQAHLAFLYMEGRYPKLFVDHIDGDKLNNAWENLREATAAQNSHNVRKLITNTSGIKGLYIRKEGIQIRVLIDGKAKTKFFSYAVYKDAAIALAKEQITKLREALHGEFANHG